ncbi:hypothetical protein CTAYLR_004901 [Chrysophaeum taylorii]|uniref:Uncharacterized protein n=1 Tax=Chrysophaeum taylorii TaxID=2483200 RepID=A0AAD7XRT4_9STRA|nr:hypothetical protein CTAYLR_004901 [Chrysophaeum taylorii]
MGGTNNNNNKAMMAVGGLGVLLLLYAVGFPAAAAAAVSGRLREVIAQGELETEGAKKFVYADHMSQEWCEWRLGGHHGHLCEWMRHAESVDVGCQFTIRSGLWSEPGEQSHSGPGAKFTFPGRRGEIVVTPKSRAITKRPMLCLSDEAKGRPVVLMVANSFEYLFRVWPYFAHKYVWATTAAKLPVALWVGGLAEHLRHSVGGDCHNYTKLFNKGQKVYHRAGHDSYYSQLGEKEINSNHFCKVLALYALIEQPGVQGMLYTDIDSVISQKFYDRVDLTSEVFSRPHATGRYDVLFGEKGPTFFRVRSNHFYMRDSILTRVLLAAWMKFRCGFKDQHALWHVILCLAKRAGCVPYANEMFSRNFTYNTAIYWGKDEWKHHFPVISRECQDLPASCPNFRFNSCDGFKDVFHHASIPSGRLTTLEYLDHRGKPATLEVQNEWALEDDLLAVPKMMTNLHLDHLPQHEFLVV